MYYAEESGIYQTGPLISLPSGLICRGQFETGSAMSFAVNKKNRMQYYCIRTLFPDAVIRVYQSIEECLAAAIAFLPVRRKKGKADD